MKTLDPAPIVLNLPKSKATVSRLEWVDNLRTWMILLVVNIHACVTYSFVGSWYYNSSPEPTIAMKIPFLEWEAHVQSFFMGLLFFIAGYYADRSLGSRGRKSFISERYRRLGLPALVYILAIHPFIVYVLHPGYEGPSNLPLAYLHFLGSGRFVGSTGPMWFAVALFIFCAVFAAVAPRLPKPNPRPFELRPFHIIGFALAVGVASFLIRLVQPLGSSVFNMQLCYFPQYLVVFPLGVWVSRRDALSDLAGSPVAKKAAIWALILGPIGLIGMMVASMPIPAHGLAAFAGGWNLSALGLAVWEQWVGVSLGLGCMWFCTARLNQRTRLSVWLSERSFGVYMLHAPVLVALALWMQPYRTNPYVMALVLTGLGLAASFGLADLARRIPLLRRIL